VGVAKIHPSRVSGGVFMHYEESLWVKFLRVLTWISLVIGIIISFIGSVSIATTRDFWDGTQFSFLTFILSLSISVLVVIAVTAYTMIYLDKAADIEETKLLIHEILKQLKSTIPENIVCSSCAKTYDRSYKSCPFCASKPNHALSTIAANTIPNVSGTWFCAQCGYKNTPSQTSCAGCGKNK
jgi:hypothetical protein